MYRSKVETCILIYYDDRKYSTNSDTSTISLQVYNYDTATNATLYINAVVATTPPSTTTATTTTTSTIDCF